MLESLNRFAGKLSGRSDLVIALIVLTAVMMMIIPLPTMLVDIIITLNITIGLMILLVGFYITSPMQFSSLPAIILISTVFRLAITITTTRLILLQADAGSVVQTFGEFVIGGNVAVGLVIFFIITISQFVVITKGGERVAEVAARFTLDALPGKQMAIDNELRNGDITQAEARKIRRELERESHLYGAMDGAMKFVKGDVIAGLVIILVNLIGGLAIGMAQQGLSFGQAVQTYSLLTIGDGLVSQIPALLVSLGAGTVVTRVANDASRDLGSDITSDLIRDPRALYLSGGILVFLSLVPGFPTPIFLALAAGLLLAGFLVHRRNKEQDESDAAAEIAITVPAAAAQKQQAVQQEGQAAGPQALPGHGIIIRTGVNLKGAIPGEVFAGEAERARSDLFEDLGVSSPSVELREDASLGTQNFRIDLHDVPVEEGEIRADALLVTGNTDDLDLGEIPYLRGNSLIDRSDAIWVDQERQNDLDLAAISYLTPAEVLGRCLAKALRSSAPKFVGIQETRALLARAEGEFGELVKEAQNVVPIQRIAEIMRRLVEENVPVRNLRLILEALVEYAPKEKDPILLSEYVRMALGPQICFRIADKNRVIAAYVLERSVEEGLRAAIRPTTAGTFLSVPDSTARPLVAQFRRVLASAKPDLHPAVLTAMDVRRHLRNLLKRNGIDLPILSYQELTPEFNVQPLATIVVNTPAAQPRTTSKPTELTEVSEAVQ